MSATIASAGHASGSKAWSIGLWVVQVLLAVMFGMAGSMKALTAMPELGEKIMWAKDVPLWFTRFIGVSELSAAIGLILPAATRIRPALTAWAAAGLAFVMLSAIGFHVMRGETPFVIMPLVLGALAAFVAWGRLRKAPIAPRS